MGPKAAENGQKPKLKNWIFDPLLAAPSESLTTRWVLAPSKAMAVYRAVALCRAKARHGSMALYGTTAL